MNAEPRPSLHDETRDDLERLAAIIAIQNDISSALQPYSLDALLARVEELTSAGGGLILLRDGAEMLVHSASGTAHALAGMRLASDESVVGPAIHSGTTVRADDTEPDGQTGALPEFGARSLIAVPVFHGDEPVGALAVLSAEPHAFRGRDVHTVQIMAGLVGSALGRSAALQWESPDHAKPVLELVQYEALHDPLTNLPREALLFDRLSQAIQLAKREDSPLAVLVLTIDCLANLRAGGVAGRADTVLRDAAQRVRSVLRASDSVARLEIDTIAVILPGANAIGALGTAKKIQRAVSQDYSLGNEPLQLTVTAGIAMFPEHGNDAVELLARARDALQHAQHDGEPLYTFASE